MHVESLKVFCDIVRCRSFSQAARENGLTQSAASQIVRHLEKRLDVRLLDRSTRPLQLTPPGQTYYDGVKGLVEQYLELEAAVRRAPAELTATVQVAAIYSVGLGDMKQTVERFEGRHPGPAPSWSISTPTACTNGCSTAPPTWGSSRGRGRRASWPCCPGATRRWC